LASVGTPPARSSAYSRNAASASPAAAQAARARGAVKRAPWDSAALPCGMAGAAALRAAA